MPGVMAHQPAEIIARLLVGLGKGTDPEADPTEPWPVYDTNEPDAPDNCITVFGTEGTGTGWLQMTGEMQGDFGVQVRVRCADEISGHLKAYQVCLALDGVTRQPVAVPGSPPATYLVWSVERRGQPLPLGEDDPNSRRSVFTVNALTNIRKTS